MPLRDDHEAALARAEALQRELDQERAADAVQEDRVKRLEQEIGEARARLGRAEEELSRLRPAKPPARSPEVEGTPGSPWRLLGILAGFGLLIALIVGATAGRSASPPPVRGGPPRPVPPFVADTLLAEGLQKLGAAKVRSISVEYVRADGTLDPTHGRIEITSSWVPPPPPPDDPSRPTGAPDDRASAEMAAQMMATCPAPAWTVTRGWDARPGSCLSFGTVPLTPPVCSIAQVSATARRKGAPEGLATISAAWTPDFKRDTEGWQWTFAIRDVPRGVQFTQSFADGDCDRPAAP